MPVPGPRVYLRDYAHRPRIALDSRSDTLTMHSLSKSLFANVNDLDTSERGVVCLFVYFWLALSSEDGDKDPKLEREKKAAKYCFISCRTLCYAGSAIPIG